MLDINLIRENPEFVKAALLKRMDRVDFTQLLANDKRHRELIQEVEKLQQRRNEVSAEIPNLKKQGQNVDALLEEMKQVSAQVKTLDAERKEFRDKIQAELDALPNMPAEDVIPGGKEANQVVSTFGKKPSFSFTAKDHVELAKSLGLIDYERGVKIGGNGFWLYTNNGAKLEWALLNYFVEEHLKDGYEFTLPPHILTWECGYTAGQFPKFSEDVFQLKNDDEEQRQFLLPTAETALINLYRDEILSEDELPKKFFGYTPCYRREAGSYRASERGMIRGHQFNKIEMLCFCTPDQSDALLDEMIAKAERLVQGLGLHYQVSKLAAQDCSASMAKTYDIELWIPSMNEYKEVSSASNAHEFQARRGKMRYRSKDSGKTGFMHTLNASGLATSRLFPAILEQHQQADGSLLLPEPLRKWLGTDRLFPEKR